MKIQNSSPVSGQTTQKTKQRSSANGVFKNLLESEIGGPDAIEQKTMHTAQDGEADAWQALNESISLLDKAMSCLQSGESPGPQMMHDIQQLRSQVQMHLSKSTGQHSELREADTLLAVEAERIRSLQS